MTTVFCALGDRLGLFAALARGRRQARSWRETRTSGRYVREWANGLVAAGHLTRDPVTGRYALPPEHAPVLADEGELAFVGGAHQMIREIRFELPGVAGQAGTTAIASISTRNSGWARPLTTAAVMTGGLGRSPHTRWNAA